MKDRKRKMERKYEESTTSLYEYRIRYTCTRAIIIIINKAYTLRI